MNSHSIYIGITLISPILNQKRYESVFNEILQYLTTHQSDLIIKIYQGFEPTQEDKKFGSIAWEVLNILKENFPSKIFLSQENLESCKPIYIPLQQTEELRRQISCLMSIKEEDRYLTTDEFEDAWSTLQFAEKINDQRSLNICLELLNQQVNNWFAVKSVVETDTLMRIISKNDYTQLTTNKILSQEILDKIQNAQQKQENSSILLNNETFENLNNNDTISQISEDTQSDFKNFDHKASSEQPLSTRMCLFQLTESNDINRVTQILQTLSNKSKETLNQLKRKYNFTNKLINVLRKYCNAEYGFEQISSRHGVFQYNLLKLFIVLSQDYVVFLECLQHQSLDFLSQLIEEGIIYAYEDALSGVNNQQNVITQIGIQNNCNNGSMNQQLFKFLKQSLDFIELAISKNYQEFLPQIRENLSKIQNRLVKLVQKKENHLLHYFILNYTNNNTSQCQGQDNIEQQQKHQVNQESLPVSMNIQLNVDQLSELKTLSYQLYDFAIDLNNKVQRVEALVDLQEEHDEKYSRLFYLMIGASFKQPGPQTQKNQQNSSREVLKAKDNIMNRNTDAQHHKVKFDIEQEEYPQKQNQIKTQTSLKKIDQGSNYTSNASLQKGNMYIRDQYEENYYNKNDNINNIHYNREKDDRYHQQHQQKENKGPYIGSPLRQKNRQDLDKRQVSRQDIKDYYK